VRGRLLLFCEGVGGDRGDYIGWLAGRSVWTLCINDGNSPSRFGSQRHSSDYTPVRL